MLAARKVSVVRGGQVVLDQVDLVVDDGSRTGILGRNGAGKSTLLRVLAGLEDPTDGAVEVSPPRLTVGYLPQEPDELPGGDGRGVPAPTDRPGRCRGRDGIDPGRRQGAS